MSAFGYKRTYSGRLVNVRFTPNSGHSDRDSESAPIERPLGLRPAHATGGTAGSVANDNEVQIAA